MEEDFDRNPLTDLTKNNWCIISSVIELEDLLVLSLTCSELRSIINENEEIWECTKLYRLTTIEDLSYDLLTDLDFPQIIAELPEYPSLRLRLLQLHSLQSICQPEEITQLITDNQSLLIEFQNKVEIKILDQVILNSLKLVKVDTLTGLYFLSFISFTLNKLQISKTWLEVARSISEVEEPINLLYTEVCQQLEDQPVHDENQTEPLTIDDQLSPKMDKLVTKLFQRYKDKGYRYLSKENIKKLVTDSNLGEEPPIEFVNHIFENFKSYDSRLKRFGIQLDQFKQFYLYFALNEPEDTRQDLGKLGFDTITLEEIDTSEVTNRIDRMQI